MSSATEQIKQIELSSHDEISRHDVPFLLKALFVMRSMAIEYDDLGGNSRAGVDREFDRRMR